MDSFTLTLYVSSLLLLQSLSFLFKDEVEEFDTSLICLSLMCAVALLHKPISKGLFHNIIFK